MLSGFYSKFQINDGTGGIIGSKTSSSISSSSPSQLDISQGSKQLVPLSKNPSKHSQSGALPLFSVLIHVKHSVEVFWQVAQGNSHVWQIKLEFSNVPETQLHVGGFSLEEFAQFIQSVAEVPQFSHLSLQTVQLLPLKKVFSIQAQDGGPSLLLVSAQVIQTV